MITNNLIFMKTWYPSILLVLFSAQIQAQVGIGTISPASTLDVRGSFSAMYRSFSGATSLTINDYTVVFNGSSATTATLPDASTCPGRTYCIKNFSAGPVPALLTLNTVSSQKIDGETIDGNTTNTLSTQYSDITIQSDGTSWYIL
jgi:hypothetical protein